VLGCGRWLKGGDDSSGSDGAEYDCNPKHKFNEAMFSNACHQAAMAFAARLLWKANFVELFLQTSCRFFDAGGLVWAR
jgi:hypothetical protein